MHPVEDVAQFMQLGGQKIPKDVDRGLEHKHIHRFIDRTADEVLETYDAARNPDGLDLPELVDGFIDTAYAAFTGAIRAAGVEKAKAVWDAVVDANLAKVDERYGPVVRNKETGKILKPEGWEPPNVKEILDA